MSYCILQTLQISQQVLHPTKTHPDRISNLVYRFSCPEDHWNAAYIGCTTNQLRTCYKQHWYYSSSIYTYYAIDHSSFPPPGNNIIKHFSIAYFTDNLSLKIAKAIIIRYERPSIKVKYNELYDFLNLFCFNPPPSRHPLPSTLVNSSPSLLIPAVHLMCPCQ